MLANDLVKSAKGASEATGGVVTERQVYRLVEEGRLPCVRIGRAMYFRKSELERVFTSDPIN